MFYHNFGCDANEYKSYVMFFERIFYVYSPGSCLPTLLTLSTAEGFPIKQIAPRNPSCSRWTGTLHLRGEAHLLLTRGLDNMVSVKVSSVNIVNMRHSVDECVHCPGYGAAGGGGDDGDHGEGHHADQGSPELQTGETGSAAQTVTTHEKLLRRYTLH